MTCDAVEIQVDACHSKFACLDDHSLLVIIAQELCMGANCDATALLRLACQNGFACLEQKQLLQVMAQSLCSGTSAATCIVCSDHDPVDGVDVPPCDCSLWTNDKVSGGTNLWKSSDGVTWKIIGTFWP